MVAKLTDATIHQSKKRYGGATILVGSVTIFQSFEDVHLKYGIIVEGARSDVWHVGLSVVGFCVTILNIGHANKLQTRKDMSLHDS